VVQAQEKIVADHTESDTRDTRLPDAGSPSASAAPADIGEHIGPYRILKVLGQGGMGVVYLAEQEHPIRRQVALKVIKLGMDTGEVVARFTLPTAAESSRSISACARRPGRRWSSPRRAMARGT
jgi:hypothetical protein